MSNREWHEEQAIGERAMQSWNARADVLEDVAKAARALTAAADACEREEGGGDPASRVARVNRYVQAMERLRVALRALNGQAP